MSEIGGWVIHQHHDVAAFVATFPEHTRPANLPKWVALCTGTTKAYVRAAERPYAEGKQIFVSKGFIIDEGQEVSVSETTFQRYAIYRLMHDRDQILGLIGLILAIAGYVVDASLTAGKIHPYLIVSDTTLFWSQIGSFLAKIVGTALVFWKGFLQSVG